MARHNRLRVVVILLAALALSACAGVGAGETPAGGGPESGSADMAIPDIAPADLAPGEPLHVVATTNIIGDVVANVGGEHIDLTVLIPRGQDPHSYEPVARDLAAVEGADVIFVNGLDLEEALLGTVESAASGPIVPISAGIEPLAFAGGEADHGDGEHTHTLDPHFWLDPNNVIVWANNAADVLSAADPAHADAYRANADDYVAQLEQLDADIRAAVERIPAANRKLITDHETFGYFADEYGFEQIAAVVPGASTTAEPSAADLAALVDLIRTEDVPAIFVGTSASGRLHDLARTVADEVGRDIQILPLYTGSLDAPGQPGDTYLGMMRFDIQQIVAGLAE
jgi:ABC-type Zn uptake system ZnuABC Zn-binding protein ZnuA